MLLRSSAGSPALRRDLSLAAPVPEPVPAGTRGICCRNMMEQNAGTNTRTGTCTECRALDRAFASLPLASVEISVSRYLSQISLALLFPLRFQRDLGLALRCRMVRLLMTREVIILSAVQIAGTFTNRSSFDSAGDAICKYLIQHRSLPSKALLHSLRKSGCHL